MTAPLLVSGLEERLRQEGRSAFAELGTGSFLLEIPIKTPLGVAPENPEKDLDTASWSADVLLALRRARGSDTARVFTVSSGAVLGRGEDCAVGLPEDLAISKEHVRFTKLGSSWLLEDMASENGTFVGGDRVKDDPIVLKSLDLLQVGGHRFAFTTADDLCELLTPNTSTQAVPVERVQAELEALGSKRFLYRYDAPSLLLAYGKQVASEFKPTTLFPLAGLGPMTVGRTPQSDLNLADQRVSKRHALITRLPGGRSEVEDLGASNSTIVAGQTLGKGEKASVSPWDTISFGGSVCGLYHSPRSLVEHLAELRQAR